MEHRKLVDNQDIMRVTSGLCLDMKDESTLAIRITEVSKNHQNQRFRIRVQMPLCPRDPSFAPAAVISDAVLILSKKNKRSANKATDEVNGTPKKPKQESCDPIERIADQVKQEQPLVDSLVTREVPDVQSSGLIDPERFNRPLDRMHPESVVDVPTPPFSSSTPPWLWANAAFELLYKLQYRCWDGNVCLCPSCHMSYRGTPKHRQDCELELLINQAGPLKASSLSDRQQDRSSWSERNQNANERGINSLSTIPDESPQLKPSQSRLSTTFEWRPSLNNLMNPSVGLESWEAYSRLSEILYSMSNLGELPGQGKQQSTQGTLAPPSLSFLGQLNTQFSNLLPNDGSAQQDVEKFLSPASAAFLMEYDNMNKTADVLRQFSRTSITDIDEREPALNASCRALPTHDSKSDPESRVRFCVIEKFRGFGNAALDEDMKLVGFYLERRSEEKELPGYHFQGLFSCLSDSMVMEIEGQVKTWRANGSVVDLRKGSLDADIPIRRKVEQVLKLQH